ncbi:hypothetical protein GUITHDRAFT_92286 [Guillardia theta CCMP2712]|uniref:Phosphagen kinase C-terminal domain-containing protein n=1 Tax=Guillardia theta (strain CCMP2712) TaxID=905079 RepID=L1JWJ9_GUITC|nr:hypothetical protein GUITHDRAFT_92286 [Guillardia theta CCMP2712]EKX52709.1 hypothetical protein GUITHDRAFT_92286 [Guillardia theta CCMP2712]|eukprot:XP_005839689.1 hypothetical protein GUITHDRAFT_92286 [Guillardia theta CCMP2712]
MRKHMTSELFEKLKGVKTSKGYSLSNGMQAGVLRPHLGVGFTCGDQECFEAFKEIIYPIVKGWHGFDPEMQEHRSDLDATKLVFTEEQQGKFSQYVKSTRVRAARNISGYSLPAGSSKEDRLAVEDVLKEAFGALPEALQGTYYPLGSLSAEQEQDLQAGGFLFQKPGPMQLLGAAGAGRDWPEGRGIFHNDAKTVLCWCNEEDQCRIIAMEEGGDVKGVFSRFCQLSEAIKTAAEGKGQALMYDERLGFLGTCPSNLGTGLRASVMIVLPELNKDPKRLEEICRKYDLQPRGSSGEHSAAVGAKWDISNKQRIGYSEVELVQKMIDGVTQLISIEEELAAAAAAAAAGGGSGAGEQASEAASGEGPDTEDFKYITFTELPPFTEKHQVLMRKHMTSELFEKLKGVKTSKGYSLSNGMQAGVLRPHLGVGFTCGDQECFEAFKEIIYPIVKGWHGFDPEMQEHRSDLDATKLVFTEEQQGKFSQYVKSTRVRAARNISGYSLPAGSSKEDRLAVEDVLKEAFGALPEALQGTYYPLGSLSAEQEQDLQAGGFLFQKPGPMQLLGAAGAGRDWPEGRGIFHNDAKTVLCWCNEEDQCRIIAMEEGGDVKGVFSRFCQLSEAIKTAAEGKGQALMYDERLGFLGTCPSNLGTGLRASVMIVLPELNKDPKRLEEICRKYDLQPRGSSGEHSAAVGAKWDISNKQRIGYSEVELVQKMIDGVTQLISIEEELAAAAAAAAGGGEGGAGQGGSGDS